MHRLHRLGVELDSDLISYSHGFQRCETLLTCDDCCVGCQAAVLCMMTMLWPTVMDRGLVLMVKFDPTLRQRYGKYITTRGRYVTSYG